MGILFALISALSVREFGHLMNQSGQVEINRNIASLAGAYLFLALMAFCTQVTDARVFLPYLLLLLYERISPKKSWEGSVGGGVFAMAASLVFAHYFPFLNEWEWIGLALTVVVFGTWGDLTESLMKRQLGIKDSGNILPGLPPWSTCMQ